MSPMSLPSAPPFDPTADPRPRSGGGASLGVAVVLLVLSGLGFLLASAFDLLLVGGSEAAANGSLFVTIAGWLLTLALWVSGIVFTVILHRRRSHSWLPAFLAGILMGAAQIGTWSLALHLAR